MTRLEDVPEQKVTKFINKTSTELGLKNHERPDILLVSELSGTGTQGDVAYNPEEGKFKIRLRSDLDWTEAKRVIGHELGHIQSSGNEYIKVFTSGDRTDYDRRRSVSSRELEARIHEAHLASRPLNKWDLANWIRQGCEEFGLERWKNTRNYMMNVAHQHRISPKTIKDAVSLIDEYYGASPRRRPNHINYHKE